MSLKIVVGYVHPTVNLATYQPMAKRFVSTYLDHPPGSYPHELYVLVNGFKYPALDSVFSPLPVKYLVHDNTGKDIGAFMMAAETIPCDLLICLGSPVHFHRAGWLDWIVEAYLNNGPGVYGAWAFHQPVTHIRTTAFWMPPEILNNYPRYIDNSQRYEFEHGRESITLWAQKVGYPTLQVTWNGVFGPEQWHYLGKDETLLLDQHCLLHGIT